MTGRVYRLQGANHADTLDYLDHRESGGYLRCWVNVERVDITPVRALTYVALPGNPYYLGPASNFEIQSHISGSIGPSGKNIDYYQELISSLRRLELTSSELSDVSF